MKPIRRPCSQPGARFRAILFILALVAWVPQAAADKSGGKRCADRLNRAVLEKSLALGTRFILNNQYPAGNFTYAYDWIAKTIASGDNSVRQAGAAWGLSLIHQYRPTEKTAAALEKALAFFRTHSKVDQKGGRYIVYPGEDRGSLGTVALTALAHIEYLRAHGAKLAQSKRSALQADLRSYLVFLVNAQNTDGLWVGDGLGCCGASSLFGAQRVFALEADWAA